MATTIGFGKLITLFNQFIEGDAESFEAFLTAGDTPFATATDAGLDFSKDALKRVKISKAKTVNFADGFEKKPKKYKEVINFLVNNYKKVLSEEDQTRTSALVRGITDHFQVAKKRIGFDRRTTAKIAETFNLSDETEKLNKTHPKAAFTAKKVVPSTLVGGGLSAAITAGVSRLAPGVFLTGHLTDFATLGILFVAGTVILATSTYKIIDFATKKYYERKYGIKVSSLEEFLMNENINVDSLTAENIDNINLGISKLLSVIDKRDAKIENSPKSAFNYARSKQNRNALHAVAKFMALISKHIDEHTFDGTRLEELRAKKKLTRTELNELNALVKEEKEFTAKHAKLESLQSSIYTWCVDKLEQSRISSLTKKVEKDNDKLGKVSYEDILIPIIRNNVPKGKKFNGKVNKNVGKDNRANERFVLRMLSEQGAIWALGGEPSSDKFDDATLKDRFKATKSTDTKAKTIKHLAKQEVKQERKDNSKDNAEAHKAEKDFRKEMEGKDIATIESEIRELENAANVPNIDDAAKAKISLSIAKEVLKQKKAAKAKQEKEAANKDKKEKEKAAIDAVKEKEKAAKQAKKDAKAAERKAEMDFRKEMEGKSIDEINTEIDTLQTTAYPDQEQLDRAQKLLEIANDVLDQKHKEADKQANKDAAADAKQKRKDNKNAKRSKARAEKRINADTEKTEEDNFKSEIAKARRNASKPIDEETARLNEEAKQLERQNKLEAAKRKSEASAAKRRERANARIEKARNEQERLSKDPSELAKKPGIISRVINKITGSKNNEPAPKVRPFGVTDEEMEKAQNNGQFLPLHREPKAPVTPEVPVTPVTPVTPEAPKAPVTPIQQGDGEGQKDTAGNNNADNENKNSKGRVVVPAATPIDEMTLEQVRRRISAVKRRNNRNNVKDSAELAALEQRRQDLINEENAKGTPSQADNSSTYGPDDFTSYENLDAEDVDALNDNKGTGVDDDGGTGV